MLDLAYVNFVLRVWLYWASRFRILIKSGLNVILIVLFCCTISQEDMVRHK